MHEAKGQQLTSETSLSSHDAVGNLYKDKINIVPMKKQIFPEK